MLVYRFYQPQNFFKKSQKKLDFLPKNGKICLDFSKKIGLTQEFFSRQPAFYYTDSILFLLNR